MINTSIEFWKLIQEKGGIDIHDPNYDKPIIDAIKINLSIPLNANLETELNKGIIRVEAFLFAFFKSVAPYSIMMSDLLHMFERAGLRHSGDNLEISFDFDMEDKLTFDVRSFRNWKENWEKISKTCSVNHWEGRLWDLSAIYRSEIAEDVQINPSLTDWNDVYLKQLRWPDKLPKLPKLDSEIEKLIFPAWDIFLELAEATASINTDRKKIKKLYDNNTGLSKQLTAGFFSNQEMIILDTDNWSHQLLNGLFHTVNNANLLKGIERTNYIANLQRRLENFLGSLRKSDVTVTEEVKRLEDFLDLPIWKQRHELYSVWISTQIIEGIGEQHVTIHHINNTLRFSFSGTHFATVNNFQAQIHLWAELRSPLLNPISAKRQSSIQPDYTLIQNPVTSPDGAVLVVECKQYKKQSTKNFSEALLDYANGRPAAKIILVNYGPVKDTLINHSVLSGVKDRIIIIGDMHPGSATSLDTFRAEVSNAVLPFQIQNNGAIDGTVSLEWGSTPTDLDLHLEILNENNDIICYSSTGKKDEYPFAYLEQDIRNGLGPEVIKCTCWLNGVYHFYVVNYSKEVSLTNSNGKVEFNLNGKLTTIFCPSVGEGEYWDVFTYEPTKNNLTVINCIKENLSI